MGNPFTDFFSDALGWLTGTDFEEQRGTELDTDPNVASIPVLYGQCKVEPLRTLRVSSGDENRWLYQVYVVSEGEIESIDEIFLDDKPITDYGSYAVATYPSAPTFNGNTKIVVQCFLGTDNQAACPFLINNVPGWTAAHRNRGKAYIAIRLRYDDELFTGAPQLTCVARGRKVYDPRTTLTAYSANPALCLRDYLTSTRYGKGLDSSRIDDTAFIQAANDLEASTTVFTQQTWGTPDRVVDSAYGPLYLEWDTKPANAFIATGGTIQNASSSPTKTARMVQGYNHNQWAQSPDTAFQVSIETISGADFTTADSVYVDDPGTLLNACNTLINTDETLFNNVKMMLGGMRGNLPYVQGQYSLSIEQDKPSSFSVTTDHIIGGIKVKGVRKKDKLNRVTAKFKNPNANWAEDIAFFPEPNSATETALLAEDNGTPLYKEITLPTVKSYYLAREIARLRVYKSRNGLQCSFVGTSELIALVPGDVIDITHPTPGWDQKLFIINSMDIGAEGEVKLSCTEHNGAIWAYDSVPLELLKDDTQLPDPFSVVAPTNLAAATTTETNPDGGYWFAIDVTYTESADVFAEKHEIRWKRDTDSDYEQFFSGNGKALLRGTPFLTTYDIGVRAWNSVNRKSPWLDITHSVVQDTTPPAVPTSPNATGGIQQITLTWTNPSQQDVREIRVYEATTDSQPGSHSYTVSAPADTFTVPDLIPSQQYYYWLTAVDNVGNESAATSSVNAQVNASSAPGANWSDIVDDGGKPEDNATVGATAGQVQDIADAQTTADSKATTFYQTSAPAANAVGDLWVDTDNGNIIYRWSGVAWDEQVTGALAGKDMVDSTDVQADLIVKDEFRIDNTLQPTRSDWVFNAAQGFLGASSNAQAHEPDGQNQAYTWEYYDADDTHVYRAGFAAFNSEDLSFYLFPENHRLLMDGRIYNRNGVEARMVNDSRIRPGFMVIGDSISAENTNPSFADKWTQLMVDEGIADLDFSEAVAGLRVSTFTVTSAVAPTGNYQHLIVELGTNDGLDDPNATTGPSTPSSVATFQSNYESMIDDLLLEGWTVERIAVVLPFYTEYLNQGLMADYKAAARAACVAKGIDEIWDVPIASTLLAERKADIGTHPSQDGYYIMRDEMHQRMSNWISHQYGDTFSGDLVAVDGNVVARNSGAVSTKVEARNSNGGISIYSRSTEGDVEAVACSSSGGYEERMWYWDRSAYLMYLYGPDAAGTGSEIKIGTRVDGIAVRGELNGDVATDGVHDTRLILESQDGTDIAYFGHLNSADLLIRGLNWGGLTRFQATNSTGTVRNVMEYTASSFILSVEDTPWFEGNALGLAARVNMNMDSNRITNAADPVDPQDYVTLAYADSNYTGGGGGVTDHGALTGLADDDHTQYHTDARGDARYYQLSETLDLQNGSASDPALGWGNTGWHSPGTDQVNLSVNGSDYLAVGVLGFQLNAALNVNNQTVNNVPTPTLSHQAANKQYVDDNAGGGSYSFMKRSSTDTASAAPTLVIPWQTAEGSSGSDVTWASGNNTRLTIATTGVYRIGGYVTFSTVTQRGQAAVEILINGVSEGVYRGGSYVRNSGSSWDYWCIEVAPEPFSLTAGDYVELRLARTSGANATYSTGGTGTIVHRGTASKIWVERAA